MRQVGIVGVGHTKFGKWEGTFLELITQAALQAMDDAGAKTGKDNVIDPRYSWPPWAPGCSTGSAARPPPWWTP